MDEKDIQSAFAHLLEAVADRVADQAAKRARGELSEDEFVNSVLRTVQSIAPDAELPLKPGEFIAPEPPPAAIPDEDPDAVLAPLLDDEEDDDGSGILGWILERSARPQDGQEIDGAPAPATAMDEVQQESDHIIDARHQEPPDAAEQSADSREASAALYEDRAIVPEAAAPAMEDAAAPEPEGTGEIAADSFTPEAGDGSLWDLEDAYAGGPAPEPEPAEPATSAFAQEDEPRWDVPAEAPDRFSPAPGMEEGDATAPAAMAAAAPEAAPYDAKDAEPLPAPEPEPVVTAPELYYPDGEPYGADAPPVDDDMPVLDLDMADAGIETEATDEAEPLYTPEPPYEDEPPSNGSPWPGPDADNELIFPNAATDADIAHQETTRDGEDMSDAPELGWEIQDVPEISDEAGHPAPSVTMARDDALDSDQEWSADESPLDKAAQAEMADDEPLPLLLEDVVDAHLPPKPSAGPDDAPAFDDGPPADEQEAPVQPMGAAFAAQDGPAPEPQAASGTPPHAADPFAFEDATQGIDGILTKAARRAWPPAPPAEPLPEEDDLDQGTSEADLMGREEPGVDMSGTQAPGPQTQEAAAPADQTPGAAPDFGALETDGLEADAWDEGASGGPPPVELPPAAPVMDAEPDFDDPAPEAAQQANTYDFAPGMEPDRPTDPEANTPSPGYDDQGEHQGPMLVDQEWEPDEDDPFADLPAPPDADEVWLPEPDAYVEPVPEPRATPPAGPARDLDAATDEGDDPFAGLPLPPDSPQAGQSPMAGGGTPPAQARKDISSHADDATAAATAAVAPPPPEPAPRREGPRIYTPKPRGAAPAAGTPAAPKGTRAAASCAHGARVIVSGSAQWENDDSHELEDTMFRLGVDEDLAHDILAPSGDKARRDRDFITKETRRALKEGGSTKNPSTAFLLSLVLPGFGSVYAGNPLGIVFSLPALALGIFFGLGQVQLEHALAGVVVLSVVSAFTAYINASEHNRRIRIREAQQPLRQEKRETTLRIK